MYHVQHVMFPSMFNPDQWRLHMPHATTETVVFWALLTMLLMAPWLLIE